MNISIRHLLRIGLLLGTLLVSILFLLTLKNVFDHSEQMRNSVMSLRILHRAAEALEMEIKRQHELIHISTVNPDRRLQEDFTGMSRHIRQRISALRDAIEPENVAQTLNELNRQYEEYVAVGQAFLKAVFSGDESFRRMHKRLNDRMFEVGRSLNRLNATTIQNLEDISQSFQNILYENATSIFGVLFFALMALWVYFFVADSQFLKPTRILVEATKRVAEGNLDSPVQLKGARELRHLGESFNAMQERLRNSQLHIEDLTESLERKVEERTAELRESQDYLDRIIYGSPVGIAIFDPEGVLRDCNVALATMLGWDSPEECVNVVSVGDEGPFGIQEFRQAFQATKMEEVIRTEPLQIDDAGRQWCSHHLVPFYSRGGALTRIICYSVDVSAERSARDQLIKKNKELESFIYSVSHDLKAPLFTISGLASILKTEMAQMTSPREAELIERILFNMQNMETLINDLLDLSRAGANPEKFTAFNPGEVVRITFLEEKVRHEVPAELKLQDNLPRILADQALVAQLFRNLISNSFKYCDRSRDLKISLTCSDSGSGKVRFHYSDNGSGIPPASLEKVFEVFYSTAGQEKEGSGVGLTIVKRIVESHGGTIRVESKLGESTTFIFTLPAVTRG